MRKKKPRVHKDSVHTEGAGKVAFSRGKNSYGAKKDGKKQILKKKPKPWE